MSTPGFAWYPSERFKAEANWQALLRAEGLPDYPALERRAATEAIHELGHTYGLSHCSDPTCVMWFSNTLSESDRKGTRFCQAHARELAGNRGGS